MEGLRRMFDDLVRFETMLWNETDARLQREGGMTLGNLNVLLIVEATPACRVQDIAKALAITVGGTSQAVDRLEKAGWCARAPHPSDRRSSIVELTDAGAEAVQRAAPIFDEALEQLLADPLDSAALLQFADSLGSLRRAATHLIDKDS
jgi:DNA-binding MarR family transcriptional regulator